MAIPGRWARPDRGVGRPFGWRVLSLVVAVVMVVSVGGQSAWASPAPSSPLTPQQRSGSAAGASDAAGSALGSTKKGASPATPAGAAAAADTHTASPDSRLSNVSTPANAQPAASGPRSAPAAVGDEIVADRTATRSVFKNSDGTQTAKVYPRPVHYRTTTGNWADINTALAQGDNGRWGEKADSASTTFAATADDPALASVPVGPGQSIAFGLQGAAHTTGLASGSTITYPGVAAHADLSYVATASGGAKETLTLASPDASDTWVFPLTLSGVTPSLGSDGSVVFTNAAGAVVGTIAHGFMRDSNIDPRSDEGVFSTGVTYSLTTVGGRPALQVSLDSAWLHDASRVFPVQVDPSVGNQQAGGSTYVMSPFNNDYSGSAELDAGTYDGGAHVANSYLGFDVSGLNNNYIKAATLNLDEIWSYSCQARPVYVSPITSGWSVGGQKTYPWVSIGGAIGNRTWRSATTAVAPGLRGCRSTWVTILPPRARN